MSQLNPQQRAAVEHTSTPLLVLAGAGSGKTRVITEKIVQLIRQGLSPRNIFAVTFTNKAAREMKTRIAQQLDSAVARQLTISTFHTLGLKILQLDGKALGYRPGFTIMDSADSLMVLKQLLQDGGHGSVDRIEDLRQQISNWKNAFILPEDAKLETSSDESSHKTALLYERYNQLLHAYNAVDFDDLILQPLQLLKQDPAIKNRWQNQIRHLLIDEYQDTNTAQYQLVQQLMGKVGIFTAVGDDDQSIYAWRGARPENMLQLQTDYPRLKLIKLEQNYRSSSRILRCANHLISHNPHVFEKRLWSEFGLGDPLRVSLFKSAEEEAFWVAAEIVSHKLRKGTQFCDYAVLYRGNFQSRPFEKALREKQTPYYVNGGSSFFDKTEVKDLLAYLRLIINPEDDTAFLRIVNTPRREIGASTLEKLATYASERKTSMLFASLELGLVSQLSERAQNRLSQFSQWISQLADEAERGTEPVQILDTVIEHTHYESWLRDNSTDLRAAERKMNNLQELRQWIEALTSRADPADQTLKNVVSHIALQDILERNTEEDASGQVQLMTLHAAKGLEFPYVFIVGMEEELLPHVNSMDDHPILEERRLAYVGITRAQKQLTFTLCKYRQRYGEKVDCEPSRFLDELPQEDLQWIGKSDDSQQSREEQLTTGKEHLASLRALLKTNSLSE
ncbi:MAG: UvrD-helicase domain-containing protein [Gammaproteobacteria bacterium]|nr:UvrD-helicase domain-containing protein [Gammaproteobacteria bacterium]